MSVFVAATRASLRSAQPALRRGLHIENTSANSLPFKAGPQNKAATGAGVAGFFTLGLVLPIVAVYYQLHK
ncbi:hypothetical protein MCUN1_003173 [Malassezia cuniculi]|uniref:Cytochrome c oxidase subunit 8, mitochondrial n=1 Tax=Malassezia cuniculi TaxID=948313 RepID=A0AAF0EW70_9BASI|nr:hypothetical protein MCUN1_003173 [Malassezia cuniculi]